MDQSTVNCYRQHSEKLKLVAKLVFTTQSQLMLLNLKSRDARIFFLYGGFGLRLSDRQNFQFFRLQGTSTVKILSVGSGQHVMVNSY